MALEEISFQSPQIQTSVDSNTQTRIFRMTDLADLPTILLAHSSFPNTFRVISYSYNPVGTDSSTGNTVYQLTVTAQRATEIAGSGGGAGASSFNEEEGFETEIEIRSNSSDDPTTNVNWESPCLVYTITKLIDTENIVSTSSGQLPVKTSAFSRVGMVNQNPNVPFRGALARRWKLVGISARRYSGTKFAITYRYKSAGIAFNTATLTLVEAEWRTETNGSSNNIYPNHKSLVNAQGDNSPI